MNGDEERLSGFILNISLNIDVKHATVLGLDRNHLKIDFQKMNINKIEIN